MKRFILFVCVSMLTTYSLAEPGRIRRAAERVPGRYVVVLKAVSRSLVPGIAADLAVRHGGRLGLTYNNAFNGFSVELTEAQALRLTHDPRVLSIDEVGVIRLSSTQSLPPDDRLWHLDRVDQRGWIFQTAGDNTYNFCERAAGVMAYMIDSGINREHAEFRRPDGTSRVINGAAWASGPNDYFPRPGEPADYGTYPCGGWTNELNGGHGTATASLVGGNTLGVAKDITLVPIRVVPCTGTSSTEYLAWGIDWIRSTANPNRTHRPAVVNISLRLFDTDPNVSAVEHAINGLVLDSPGWTGIPVIVSANNQGSPNSRTSPARMAYRNAGIFLSPGRVISVGGIAENDARWQCRPELGGQCLMESAINDNNLFDDVPAGSNYGNTVDIYAPAHNIESAHIACDTCVRGPYPERSGTSFAAPIVTGLAARLLQVEQNLTPTQVWDRLQQDASRPWPIDDENGNSMIAYREGAAACFPEHP